MGKLSKVLIFLGVVLLVAGFGIQIVAANNSDFKMISEFVEGSTGKKLTPQLVNNIVNNGFETGWGRVSIDEVLSSFASSNSETGKIVTYARAYAATPIMIYGGVGALVLGILMFVASKRG